MRPTSITVSSAASSAWIPLDYKQNPFNVGFAVVIPSGTLTYKVEHTFDDVYDTSVTPTAFTHSSVSGETTNQDGNYAFPVRAVRLTVTSWTSGSAVLTILQGVR
jgi:hypothetical protein